MISVRHRGRAQLGSPHLGTLMQLSPMAALAGELTVVLYTRGYFIVL